MSTEWKEIVAVLSRERLLEQAGLNPGATEKDLGALEAHLGLALPASLRAFLAAHNGQGEKALFGIYDGSELLSTNGIRQEWDAWRAIDEADMNDILADDMSSDPPGAVKPLYTNRRWIPLTRDGQGNHVSLDFDPDTAGIAGQVIVFGRDQEEKQVMAASFESFLPTLLAVIQSADWEDLRSR